MYYYIETKLGTLLQVDAIYTIHYFEYYKAYSFKGETHDFWELLYIDKGQILVQAGDHKLSLQQGQLIFHQPNEFHSVAANGNVAPNTIVISFSCHSPAMQALIGCITYVNQTERTLLANIIQEAKDTFTTDLGEPEYRKLEFRTKDAPIGSEQLIRLYLETLLISILRKRDRMSADTVGSTIQHNLEYHYFDITREYIKNNIDATFSLQALSQQAMVSTSYLERLFRRFAGMSVIQYCNRYRVDQAKQLIREDRMNISQIAEYLGFSSIHYFSRVFKNCEGMSPSEYGRSVKALKDHSDQMDL